MNILIIKILVGAALIIAAILYVYDLKNTVLKQQVTISELQAGITLQNISITNAGNEKKKIEENLKVTTVANLKLSKELADAKWEIDHRPDATTCESAVGFLSDTAKQVADDWNAK